MLTRARPKQASGGFFIGGLSPTYPGSRINENVEMGESRRTHHWAAEA
jgi:hypothetical protein